MPELQPHWDIFEEFLTALHQQFGMLNNDQYILVSEIAATLSVGMGVDNTHDTWEAFLDFLKKLTSNLLGELNHDQYLTALDIAARLTSRGKAGGLLPGAFHSLDPLYGDGTALDPLGITPATAAQIAAGTDNVFPVTPLGLQTKLGDYVLNTDLTTLLGD